MQSLIPVAALYLLGWLGTALWFGAIDGPVPLPGRWRRDAADALVWPLWLVLFALFWMLALRRQRFDAELPHE